MKQKYIYLGFEAVWIFLLVVVISLGFPTAPSWPMFFTGLFYSIYKESKSMVGILIHAISGLASAYAYHYGAQALYVRFPTVASLLLPVLPALAVVLFGCVLAPKLFGMTSFAFFSVICAAPEGFAMPLEVFGVLLIGGTLNMLSSHWAEKVIAVRFSPKPVAPQRGIK